MTHTGAFPTHGMVPCIHCAASTCTPPPPVTTSTACHVPQTPALTVNGSAISLHLSQRKGTRAMSRSVISLGISGLGAAAVGGILFPAASCAAYGKGGTWKSGALFAWKMEARTRRHDPWCLEGQPAHMTQRTCYVLRAGQPVLPVSFPPLISLTTDCPSGHQPTAHHSLNDKLLRPRMQPIAAWCLSRRACLHTPGSANRYLQVLACGLEAMPGPKDAVGKRDRV
jgi:hypothetical protein